MKVVVTGGAGFIGSHLTSELVRRNHVVTVVDNLSTGKLDNLLEVAGQIEFIQGDIRDYDVVHQAMTGAEVVFHGAALPSVPRSIEDPVTSVEVNALGTAQVLKAAVDAGVRRVVYAASSSAYGNADASIKHEALFPNPLSPYAVSKLTGEYLVQAFSNCYGLETVALRYFNVFGERQDPHSPYSGVIAKFCKVMLRGESPVIYGDGLTSRDFTYVSNVVTANLLAAEAPSHLNGRVMNIACGSRITLLDLVAALNEILGINVAPRFANARTGDIRHSCADIALAKSLLSYEPVVPFKMGLRRTVAWYQSHLEAMAH